MFGLPTIGGQVQLRQRSPSVRDRQSRPALSRQRTGWIFLREKLPEQTTAVFRLLAEAFLSPPSRRSSASVQLRSVCDARQRSFRSFDQFQIDRLSANRQRLLRTGSRSVWLLGRVKISAAWLGTSFALMPFVPPRLNFSFNRQPTDTTVFKS